LDEVSSEAQRALRHKTEHLDGSFGNGDDATLQKATSSGGPFLTTTVVVRNPHGLHARPAAEFIRLAGKFDCEILVRNLSNDKGPASANSMSELASMEILQGHEIELDARGPDAQSALTNLKSRIEAGLGETLESPPLVAELPAERSATASAAPVSPGIVIGPLFFAKSTGGDIPVQTVSDTRKEKEKLRRAIEVAKAELVQDEIALKQSLGEEEAAIFRAQALILEDPALLQFSEKAIEDEHQNAALAWQRSYQAAAISYQRLSDEYLRQRAADVQDIGHRVLQTCFKLSFWSLRT
jgi:multiphosphoryl transfer protein